MRDRLGQLSEGMAELDMPGLMRRVEKLSKINAALMQRVERSVDQQANAYSLFQAAIALENQVRVRTEELKSALDRLEKTNDELVTARDAADMANRFKTRFFTAVGHDLLQPLHAARLSLSAMEEIEVPNGNLRLASQVDHALSTIEEMLRTILDLSQLEAGAIRPTMQTVALSEIFRSLSVDMEPIARSKNLALTWRATSAGVVSDPLMLRRILQNLMSNAVRYTQQGGIKLGARRRGDRVLIQVWDTGPGVAPAERGRIFEEFQRGSAAERSAGGGFGLGLSIVQRTAEALGHQVELCSRVGTGTRVSVSARYAGVVNSSIQEPNAETAQKAYGFSASRVVVIDNDRSVLEAMSTLLERWSCDVRFAADLADAEAVASRDSGFAPDIVIADYHLENGQTGLAAVARLREIWGQGLPTIVITADHSPMVVDAALRARCEVLRKPVRPAELRALMQHLLS